MSPAEMNHRHNPIVTRSGKERLIEWCNTLLRDNEGHVSDVQFRRGFTERHEATEALRKKKSAGRNGCDSGPGKPRALDLGPDYTTGKLQWSEILESQYGLQPGTFGGTFEAFMERVHLKTPCAARDDGEGEQVGRRWSSVEHRALWTDGTVRWLSGAGRIRLGEHGPNRCAVSAFLWTSRNAIHWRSSISRLRRWKRSDGWPRRGARLQ